MLIAFSRSILHNILNFVQPPPSFDHQASSHITTPASTQPVTRQPW